MSAWKSKACIALVAQLLWSEGFPSAGDARFASEGWVVGSRVCKHWDSLEMCSEIPPSKCGVGPTPPAAPGWSPAAPSHCFYLAFTLLQMHAAHLQSLNEGSWPRGDSAGTRWIQRADISSGHILLPCPGCAAPGALLCCARGGHRATSNSRAAAGAAR